MQGNTAVVAVIAIASMTLEDVSGKPSVDVKAVGVKSLLQSLKALQQNRQQDRYGSLNNQYNAQSYGYKKQSVGNRQQYYDRYTKQKDKFPDNKPVFDESDYDKDVSNDVIKVLDRKPYKNNSVYKQKLFNAKALKDLFIPKRAKPSSLLGSEDVLDLDKYSRIYVVLNPQALKQDKDVADLVSEVARAGAEDGLQQYGGFVVNNELLRRASGRGDDMFDEPVGKRPRHRGLGEAGREGYGGGGAGGRTAIPYLKHRGNIYERED